MLNSEYFIVGLELTAHTKDALVFYFGPMRYTDKLDLQDFMSLELQDGNPVLYVDYGQGSIMLDKAENSDGRKNKLFLADGKPHRIDIYWTKTVSNHKNRAVVFFEGESPIFTRIC